MAVVARIFAVCLCFSAAWAGDLPRDWIDAKTGHRVVRLSDEPGSTSLYFNFNAFTPDGRTLVFSAPTGIVTMDLKTRALKKIVSGKAHLLFVGRKTGAVYYDDGEAGAKTIYAVSSKGGAPRRIAKIAAGSIQTINADETALAGVEELAPPQPVGRDGLMRDPQKPQTKGEMMKARLEAKIPMRIFTLDIKTGALRTVTQSTDWLNHLQFSPTDPGQLVYCHEGDWHRVDRIWTIRTDRIDAQPVKLHTRTMAMEIAGHEWFSADGRWLWYDLQTPRGEDFWVAGIEFATGKRIRYHLQRNEWSVHFNSAPDGALFSGDGGSPQMVAHAPDGQWLYLFRPSLIGAGEAGDHAGPQGALIQPGVLTAEKLVDMKTHDYRLEPNATFTPDGKWLVFRSNMHGPSHVYAVEIAKQ